MLEMMMISNSQNTNEVTAVHFAAVAYLFCN